MRSENRPAQNGAEWTSDDAPTKTCRQSQPGSSRPITNRPKVETVASDPMATAQVPSKPPSNGAKVGRINEPHEKRCSVLFLVRPTGFFISRWHRISLSTLSPFPRYGQISFFGSKMAYGLCRDKLKCSLWVGRVLLRAASERHLHPLPQARTLSSTSGPLSSPGTFDKVRGEAKKPVLCPDAQSHRSFLSSFAQYHREPSPPPKLATERRSACGLFGSVGRNANQLSLVFRFASAVLLFWIARRGHDRERRFSAF